jgi:mercuric ion transport protein
MKLPAPVVRPSTARSGPTGPTDNRAGTMKVAAAGSVLSALAVVSCCILPFALFGLGVGGAWIGSLTRLAPYQPVFVLITLGLLSAGFYLVYRKPRAPICVDGNGCAPARHDRLVKTSLWIATILVIAGIAFPYLETALLRF